MGKKEKSPIGTITLKDGTKKTVIKKAGKFYICKDAQYFIKNYKLEKATKELKEERSERE